MLGVASVLCKQLITMALYMLVGYILIRTKMFTPESNRHLTNVLIYIISPLLTLSCFNLEYTKESFRAFFLCLLLSGIMHFLLILFSFIAKIKGDPDLVQCERFGIIFGNTGFIGTPLTIYLLGTIGGFYNVALNIVFNSLNWTYGLVMIGRAGKRRGIKDYLKLFNHPLFYMIGIGFVMYATRIHFPDVIQNAVDNLGNMTSPIAMICCGMYLSQGRPFLGFKKPRLWFLCFCRLVAAPFIVLGMLKVIPVDHVMAMAFMVAAACPMASITIFFSNDSKKRLDRSMEFFIMSMLLSIVTMPLIVGYASTIL